MSKVITLWAGKNVNDMTKAELIQALIESNELHDQDRKLHAEELQILTEIRAKGWLSRKLATPRKKLLDDKWALDGDFRPNGGEDEEIL